jgi:ferrous-iron efflux pump FieF
VTYLHLKFIKGNDRKDQLIKAASYLSILISVFIIIAKLAGWLLTDSVSILASLVDSFLDVGVSLLNLVAVHYALQPPDNEHRFGHGKAEDLAVFVQSAFLGASGIVVAAIAIKRIFSPQIVERGAAGIGVMVFSIILTIGLVLFQRHVIRETKSNVIEADSFHYAIDLLSNILIVAGIILSYYFDITLADPIFALGISLYILFGAWKLLYKAFKNLMDHEFSDEEKEKIVKIIRGHPKVSGFHDLKTRYSGSNPFIQLHLEMDGRIPLQKAHDIAHEIEQEILKIMPSAEILIHQDPEGLDEKITYKD